MQRNYWETKSTLKLSRSFLLLWIDQFLTFCLIKSNSLFIELFNLNLRAIKGHFTDERADRNWTFIHLLFTKPSFRYEWFMFSIISCALFLIFYIDYFALILKHLLDWFGLSYHWESSHTAIVAFRKKQMCVDYVRITGRGLSRSVI